MPCRNLRQMHVLRGGPLTRSHIWPEWAQKIVPATSTHYELNVGQLDTFVSTVPGPEPFAKKLTGSSSKRQPRNTCLGCNGGWMREIEEAARPLVSQLMLGRATIIDVFSQRLLAAFLCLVSMRVEFGGVMRAIPKVDHDRLKNCSRAGSVLVDCNFSRILTKSRTSIGADTLVCGARVYLTRRPSEVKTAIHKSRRSSLERCARTCSARPSGMAFVGMKDFHLTQIWPPRQLNIDARLMPCIDNFHLPWVHEAIARDGMPPD